MSNLDISKVDFLALKVTTVDAVLAGIEDLIEGAKEDVKLFAVAITSDLLLATLQGLDRIVNQLLEQIEMVAELNRIRVVKATWAAITKIIKAILSAVLAGIMATI